MGSKGYVIAVISVVLAGCGADQSCKLDADCAATPDTPSCAVATGACEPRPTLIGQQGALTQPTMTLAYVEDSPRLPTGLAFNPKVDGQLWVVNQKDDSVILADGATTASLSAKRLRDPAAAHFMHLPTGIAFTEDGLWATCGENDNGGDTFTGPAMFTSDLSIFAKQTADGLGSHLDMLHASPFCMGITHETGNAFWVFDGEHGALVRYDFGENHEPGADDHSDGEIRFYAQGQVARAEGIPSHLAFNPADQFLYASDTGHQRVVKLDTKAGVPGEELPTLEPSVPVAMDGTSVVEVIAPGVLAEPSGLVIDNNLLYITDRATGAIVAFDLAGRQWARLDTGLGAGTLAGLAVGPDKKLYVLAQSTASIYRIELAQP